MKKFVFLIFAFFINSALAEPVTNNRLQQEISQDSLENMIDSIDARQDLEEEIKTNALKLYRQAKENLRTDEWYRFLSSRFEETIKKSPALIKSEQLKIDALQKELTLIIEKDFTPLSILDLEQQQAINKTQLNDLEVKIAKLEAEQNTQETRLNEIRQQTDLIKQSLRDTEKRESQINEFQESSLERQGKQLQLKTLKNQYITELKMLAVEMISQPMRLQLLKTRYQHLILQRQVFQTQLKKLAEALEKHLQLEAEKLQHKLLEAEKESVNKHFAIQLLNKENVVYSHTLQTLAKKIKNSHLQIEILKSQQVEIEQDFKSAEKKISLSGLSPALGKILREQRRLLIKKSDLNPQVKFIQNETAQASLEQFRIETQLKEQSAIEKKIQHLLNSKKHQSNSPQQQEKLTQELTQLLITNNQLLKRLIKSYGIYLRSLGDYDFEQQQLLKRALDYAQYLDKRLLWVTSSEPINLKYFHQLQVSSKWLFSLNNWQFVLHDLTRTFFKYSILSFLVFALLIWLSFFNRDSQQKLCELSEMVSKLYSDQFRYTLNALLYTFLIVLPLPLVLFFISWLLSYDNTVADFSFAVGKGLESAFIALLFLEFFYRLFAPCGIIIKHFNWTEISARQVCKQLAWVRFSAPPAIFILISCNYSQLSIHGDSLGRLALITTMVFVSIAIVHIFHPKKALVSSITENYPDRWLVKLRYLIFISLLLLPLVVIGFAVAGYYLSALELQQKVIISMRLIFIFIIIHQVIMRWLSLTERQLALHNARQKREAAQSENSEVLSLHNEELLIDIPKVNEQTNSVLEIIIGLGLAIGFWMTWRDIFPAFSFLENVVLWQHIEIINAQEQSVPTTLKDLLLVIVYIFITSSAVRNFSGIMEVVFFRRWNVELGSRYAINQLARYLLVALGVIFITNQLGGNWSQLQWLVAALSVGLGFGLQEIFANLVSGIILLSERPIRIGDTITVGNISGKVSRIQMRATHILDWDKKELIIPNKIFITDQLINWSLSDQITRVVIPLGIAYGSDVEFSYQVINETIQSTPLVLKDPEPSVFFIGFGNSSLDFSIRVYVAELNHRLEVTHDLHIRLNKALAQHNIEIPFPQHDIHIRSGLASSANYYQG